METDVEVPMDAEVPMEELQDELLIPVDELQGELPEEAEFMDPSEEPELFISSEELENVLWKLLSILKFRAVNVLFSLVTSTLPRSSM